MTSDADMRKVLRMLGQAVYSWGIHSLDDDATSEQASGFYIRLRPV